MRFIKQYLLPALVLLALAACGRPTHVYTDTKDVKVDAVSHVAEGDFLVVTARLVNSSKSAVNNSVYRIQWYDAKGNLLEESAWRPVVVKGGAPVYVKERSTVPGAKEYTILISNDAS